MHHKNGKYQSVEVCLVDKTFDLRVFLLYTVFEEYDIIAKSVIIENHTGNDRMLKAKLIDEKTVMVLNHFSHNGINSNYTDFEPLAS